MFRRIAFVVFCLIFIPVFLWANFTREWWAWATMYILLILAMFLEVYFDKKEKR